MELSEPAVRDRAGEYADSEPLYDVERQHVETVARTFAGDEYGRRDAQWIVRWYFRRYLGDYPDGDRREREEAFRDNDFGDVVDALDAAIEAIRATDGDALDGDETADESIAALSGDRDVDAALSALAALDGVDVAVASGFLQFLAPERFVAVDRRTWRVLAAAGELDGPYPDPPSVADYRRFDVACRSVMERTGVDAWTLYRALWRSFSVLSDDSTAPEDA
ncbi:hypothetical protein EXE53_21630 [Halorubrum sp. SD626R]|uniref:hypothetical protein n=1 Tax=Halorubrum sp. SD626R TaxID=1419722 RepID=UPI0010F675C4|nr:hypothetical protein [Halorubrum sp. SD626R]TKX78358.1 hypothetical protein EXE53_21630 [Halorubrum sp. SD626R]